MSNIGELVGELKVLDKARNSIYEQTQSISKKLVETFLKNEKDKYPFDDVIVYHLDHKWYDGEDCLWVNEKSCNGSCRVRCINTGRRIDEGEYSFFYAHFGDGIYVNEYNFVVVKKENYVSSRNFLQQKEDRKEESKELFEGLV